MANVYFNNKKLPTPKREYVAFVDIMGTQARMNKSVKECATYIFKLHSAIISSWREKAYKNVFVYPVMDGAYITSSSKEAMENILLRIFRSLYEEMKNSDDIDHMYLVRCAVAYGEVIHGHTVPYDASKAFELNLGYKDNILLGKAMIDAYRSECLAAPFGIYIHESALKHGDDRRYGCFSEGWKWYTSDNLKLEDELASNLMSKMNTYFDSMKDVQNPLHYPDEKVELHRNLMLTYFARG